MSSAPLPAQQTSPLAVPDDLRGVWSRTSWQSGEDEAASPSVDTSTWVRWLQTSLWHGDLRVPEQALAGRVAQPLALLSGAQRAALSVQQGFAGITQCEHLPEGPVCTWLRRLDYQPPGLHPDAGLLLFDQPDRVIEIGVHEDYTETWERLPDSVGRYVVLARHEPDGHDTGERWLLAGAYLMRVRPRGLRWPKGMRPGFTLGDVLLHSPQQACDWLDCEISFGRLAQGEWRIERSTLPEMEGACIAWRSQRVDASQALVHTAAQASSWAVLEWSCDEDRIAR